MSTTIDFRDGISVNLIGLKDKDLEYIKDYCKKHPYFGCGMTLEDFVIDALRYYLKELRAKENKDTMTVNKTNDNEVFNMENKTIEFDVGLKKVKFNVVKLKDCKYFIEDVTYTNPIEYTVNLMLYPEDSPNADCAIITVHHNTLLPIEINCTNGVVDAKTICMCYEFREDSQRFVDFIDKYTRVMLDSLKCNAMDVLNRKGFPMVDSTYRDEDAEVTYTKEAINALIDDYIIRRHSMTNLLWYLDILCKKERDELY